MSEHKQYSIILADPPWRYGAWHKNGKRAPDRHYPTLTTADLCALPVSDLAANNAVLFMWTTWPHMQEAMQVIAAWGFKYKTAAFVWVKTNRSQFGLFTGCGAWTRANSEPCLLATRGRVSRVSRSVRQVVLSPLREHSRKPDEVHERIVQLMGDVPRVELFARRPFSGWDVWGNEVDSDIALEGIA